MHTVFTKSLKVSACFVKDDLGNVSVRALCLCAKVYVLGGEERGRETRGGNEERDETKEG